VGRPDVEDAQAAAMPALRPVDGVGATGEEGEGEMTALSNPMDQFQSRILGQIKENIHGLLPDEALKGLVERAVKEVFFDPQKLPKPGRWGGSTETIDGPSWFADEVGKQVRPLVEKHVADYLEANPQIVKDAVDAALDRDKVAVIMAYSIGTQLQSQMGNMVYGLVQELRNQPR